MKAAWFRPNGQRGLFYVYAVLPEHWCTKCFIGKWLYAIWLMWNEIVLALPIENGQDVYYTFCALNKFSSFTDLFGNDIKAKWHWARTLRNSCFGFRLISLKSHFMSEMQFDLSWPICSGLLYRTHITIMTWRIHWPPTFFAESRSRVHCFDWCSLALLRSFDHSTSFRPFTKYISMRLICINCIRCRNVRMHLFWLCT